MQNSVQKPKREALTCWVFLVMLLEAVCRAAPRSAAKRTLLAAEGIAGSRLRIVLFEVGEKGSVREVLEARGIVRHDIGTPWDEEVCLAVPVLPLVGTGVVAEVGSWPVGRDRSFQHSGQGGGVASSIGDGGVAHVVVVSHEGGLGKQASLLKVAVGDVALGVVGRDQPRLDILGERLTPKVSLAGAIVVDTKMRNKKTMKNESPSMESWNRIGERPELGYARPPKGAGPSLEESY